MSDVSAFMAYGKRFSLDIKLFGGGRSENVIQCEFDDITYDCELHMVEVILPRVVEVLSRSTSDIVRERVASYARSMEMAEYPTSEIFHETGKLVVSLNQAS